MSNPSELERRCADLEELLSRERVARKLAQDQARANGTALRVLAREVRAPLEAGAEWTGMLRRELLSTTGREHALGVVERQIEGAMRLIDDVVSSIEATTPRPTQFQLDEIVSAAKVDAASRLERKKLSCALELAPVVLHADSQRTSRVIARLFEAAIDLASEGSELRVVLRGDGLTCTFDSMFDLPEAPMGSWDAVTRFRGPALPYVVNLFLLQQHAAARGARLEIKVEERRTTLLLLLVRGQDAASVPFPDHELRTPLQVLTIGVELLRTRVRDSADDVPRGWMLERLDALEQAVDHLSAAVERLSAGERPALVESPSVAPRS